MCHAPRKNLGAVAELGENPCEQVTVKRYDILVVADKSDTL